MRLNGSREHGDLEHERDDSAHSDALMDTRHCKQIGNGKEVKVALDSPLLAWRVDVCNLAAEKWQCSLSSQVLR